MAQKLKRIKALLKQLYQTHQQLFGKKYIPGMELNQKSEFNTIIQSFRQIIFMVRHQQEERTQREQKKNFERTPEGIRINSEIRQGIARAAEVLAEAIRRCKSKEKKVIEAREKIIQNCYEILKDAQEIENGGVYEPPSYPTLKEITKKLVGNNRQEHYRESINVEEQEALEQFDKGDKQMDNYLEEIINVNQEVQGKMTNANEKVDQSKNKVKELAKKADSMTQRIKKADNNLAEILKSYRRPSKLCLDLTLGFMLLALIGVIINMIRSS